MLYSLKMDNKYLLNIKFFAEALEQRANTRGYEPFRPECRADIEYMRKAAQLLQMVTEAYIQLSNQIGELYAQNMELHEAAAEAAQIVENQQKMQELWPGFEQEPPRHQAKVGE